MTLTFYLVIYITSHTLYANLGLAPPHGIIETVADLHSFVTENPSEEAYTVCRSNSVSSHACVLCHSKYDIHVHVTRYVHKLTLQSFSVHKFCGGPVPGSPEEIRIFRIKMFILPHCIV